MTATPDSTGDKAPVRSWAVGRLDPLAARLIDRIARAEDVRNVAIMPDVHAAHEACVGTVFATRDLLYPETIGGDLGCGVAAVPLDLTRHELGRDGPGRLLEGLRTNVPITRRRAGSAPPPMDGDVGPPAPDELSDPALRATAARDGPRWLGTLGTGNHFLEAQFDPDDGRIWLMVHSGSRGIGPAIRDHHARAWSRGHGGLRVVEATSGAGEAWLADLAWARTWARANRAAMLSAAVAAIEDDVGGSVADPGGGFDSDHNHVSLEDHGDGPRLVHRKGAMSAADRELGAVPGSMGTRSFHVAGRGVDAALRSSAHGAGRAVTRSEARRRFTRDHVRRDLRGVHVDPRAIGGLAEETPSAYKDVAAVMNAQRELVAVRRVLEPVTTHRAAGSSRGGDRRDRDQRRPRPARRR